MLGNSNWQVYSMLLVASGLLTCGSTSAEEGGPNWNFAEVGYAEARIYSYNIISTPGEPFKIDSDGFGIGGSFQIGEHFFAQANYIDQSADFGQAKFETDVLDIGVGFRAALNNTADYFAIVSYLKAEGELDLLPELQPRTTREDDGADGFSLAIGLRAIRNQFDLEASLDYRDFGSQTIFSEIAFDDDGGDGFNGDGGDLDQVDGSALSLRLSGHYLFSDRFGVGIRLRVTGDGTDWIAGIRAYF